jgi:hypothetical protein
LQQLHASLFRRTAVFQDSQLKTNDFANQFALAIRRSGMSAEETEESDLIFQFRVGQEVQYYTQEGKQWISTTITWLDLGSRAYKVGCKKNHLQMDNMGCVVPEVFASIHMYIYIYIYIYISMYISLYFRSHFGLKAKLRTWCTTLTPSQGVAIQQCHALECSFRSGHALGQHPGGLPVVPAADATTCAAQAG